MTEIRDKNLSELLKEAAAKVAAMSEPEREAMFKVQREGVARAEASWPKANYHWDGNVKVYHSYEDYLND